MPGMKMISEKHGVGLLIGSQERRARLVLLIDLLSTGDFVPAIGLQRIPVYALQKELYKD